jgi:UDP-N-acetyl-D-mannosaminuronic acid dehydrogenase
MSVAVIGLGYIGLPTAALLAQGGNCVYGYDADPRVRKSLRHSAPRDVEQAVQQAVEDAMKAHQLHVVDRIPAAHAYIICVPTPTLDGKPDLHYVEDAAAAVAAVAPKGSVLVLESTVPPGTTERIFEVALRNAGKSIDDFHVAHCPERVIPGAIVTELRANARVVGGRRIEDAMMVRDLYATFCEGTISITTTTVAEFVKVIENTFRDVNIAFANELAIFCEELGIDVWEAISLANAHPRVSILAPGPGVGGHCIPVDPHFLADANPVATELIQTARRINERMPYRLARRIAEIVGPAPAKIAILGAAYKADVSDARESPSERIDHLLRERGYETSIYDPFVRRFSRPLALTVREAVSGADALVLVTPHRIFSSIAPHTVGGYMRSRNLIDTRNVLDPAEWTRAGFDVYTLGRAPRARAQSMAAV